VSQFEFIQQKHCKTLFNISLFQTHFIVFTI